MERLDFVFTSFLGVLGEFLLFCYGVFKLSLLGASLELSMKTMTRFLAELPKETRLLPLARLSVSLLCLQVREIPTSQLIPGRFNKSRGPWDQQVSQRQVFGTSKRPSMLLREQLQTLTLLSIEEFVFMSGKK